MTVSVNIMQSAGIFVKEISRLRLGEEVPGHEHPYDHLTFLFTGIMELTCNGTTKTHKAPSIIEVPKDNIHRIKALTDDVTYTCVFAWRDEFGKITDDITKLDKTLTGVALNDEIFKRVTALACGSCEACA